jgi:hypothetical protein
MTNIAAPVQLVEILSANKVPQRLKAAREAFADRFPLPANIWLAWLHDAAQEITSDEGATQVLQLAERSVRDYLSVGLWQQCLVCASTQCASMRCALPAFTECSALVAMLSASMRCASMRLALAVGPVCSLSAPSFGRRIARECA